MEKRKCFRKKCGAEFTPTKPKQKYCSTKCRTYAYRESLVKDVVEQIIEEPKAKPPVDVRTEEPHKQPQFSSFMQKRQQLKNGNK